MQDKNNSNNFSVNTLILSASRRVHTQVFCGFTLCSLVTQGPFLPFSVTQGQSSQLTQVCLAGSRVRVSGKLNSPLKTGPTKGFLYLRHLLVVMVFLTFVLWNQEIVLACFPVCLYEEVREKPKNSFKSKWSNSICLPDLTFSTQFLSFSDE